MKFTASVAALLATESAATSPINKVVQMISELEAKIIKEGSNAQKVFEEYSEWCEDRSRELGFEIKTGTDESRDLKAAIAKAEADAGAYTEKIDELGSELGVDKSDLKAASDIRAKEAAVFAASEKELTETIDTLQRAVGIIEKEMNKGGAAFLQGQHAGDFVQALKTLVEASAISSADGAKLTVLLQSSSSDEDSGAPAGSVYENQSGGILDTLNGLLEKAENQLEEARTVEMANQQNFNMIKQKLDDEIKYGQKEMAETKKKLAASKGAGAEAEGDLEVTSKELAEDVKAKEELHHECMSTAENFEAETKSRGEELKALGEAKKIIKETTGGAAGNTYSFMQVSESSATADALRLIRDLASAQKSPALVALAQRMRVAMGSSDQFGKIKDLIRDMISKLEAEAEADAKKKAWCDRNLADANEKKSNQEAEIEKLTSKIDSQSAQSAKLKEEVAELQESLAALAKSQVEMNKLREEQNAAYKSEKADLEQGLNGVKLALKVLRDYYASADKAHDAATGASDGIIGLLEVCESDFSKELAEVISTEEAAVAAYEEQTKENEIETTTKNQDVKYKVKESKHLDKTSAELSEDRRTVQSELEATNKLLSELEEKCVDKAQTYEEQVARRNAELAGLKEALQILRDETAFLQKKTLRVTRRHA